MNHADHLIFSVAVPRASQTDREIAINHVAAAHKIFSDLEVSREHKRSALLIEIIGRMTRSGGLLATLHVTSRLGASLIYDCTLHAALLRNKNPQTGELASGQTWVTISESADLPPAPEEMAGYMSALSSNSRQGSGSGSDASPMLENYMQMDQAWMWGMWDDQIFDSLAQGTAFEEVLEEGY